MRRSIGLSLVVALVALVLVGCGQSARDAEEGDGLHSTVPAVVGMNVFDAREELERAGYELGEVTPSGARGEVISQSPTAGYSAPRGEAVDLVVGE